MTSKSECRKRSKAAEEAGDERKALYWSRREVGKEPLPERLVFASRHGSAFALSAQQRDENGGHPYAIRAQNQAVTSRKQMSRIVSALLAPMGPAFCAAKAGR